VTQDEDHEAALREARDDIQAFIDGRASDQHLFRTVERIDAYLSRCPSPERNTEKDALQALVDEARADDEWVSGNDLLVRVGALVLDRLAEFSSTTKEKG